jgi:hypothetical protein
MFTEDQVLKELIFFDLKPIDPSLPEEERMRQLYVTVRQQVVAFKLMVLAISAQAAVLTAPTNPVIMIAHSMWESLISTLESTEAYFKIKNLPLPDIREVQKQHAREMLNDPNLSEAQRNDLLALLAEDLNGTTPKPEDDLDRWFPKTGGILH